MGDNKNKFGKASLELRGYPWQSYLLPGDGRKGRQKASERRELANYLATFANGDGSSICPAIETIVAALGWSKRTVYRRLDELALVGPGLLTRTGLSEYRGTAKRKLNVAVLAGVPDSTVGVPDSDKSECQIGDAGVPDSISGVPDRIAGVPHSAVGVPKPADFGTRPSRPVLPIQTVPTDQMPVGWLEHQNLADMGKPSKEHIKDLTTLAADLGLYGWFQILDAVSSFKGRPQGLVGMKRSAWDFFLEEAPQYIRSSPADIQSIRLSYDPAYQAEWDAAVQKNVADYAAALIPEDHSKDDALFAEFEKSFGEAP